MGIKYNPLTKQIYVADQSNHRIVVLDSDVGYYTSFGTEQLLTYPRDVAFDSDNNIYVTDSGNGRIQVFSEFGSTLRQIGEKGTNEGQLLHPNMITIDKDNLIYVTDLGNHRVSVFTRSGDHLTSFGSEGTGPQNFKKPFGIAVDDSGKVYVCDLGNNRVQVF